jgi:hypothetical protein
MMENIPAYGAFRRWKILDFIVEYKSQHDGCAPTLREIGDACGEHNIGLSTSMVKFYLKKLEEERLIVLVPSSGRGTGRARYIEVIGGQWILKSIARGEPA